MREIKFEIKVIAKEPINGYKSGETVIFVNSIFNRSNGIAFFPIDKNFDIVYQRQYTGLKDRNGLYIFEDSILSDGENNYRVWIEDGKMLIGGVNKEWDEFISPNKINQMKIIGNIHQNPELL